MSCAEVLEEHTLANEGPLPLEKYVTGCEPPPPTTNELRYGRQRAHAGLPASLENKLTNCREKHLPPQPR